MGAGNLPESLGRAVSTQSCYAICPATPPLRLFLTFFNALWMGCMCHSVHMELRGQLEVVYHVSLPCGSQGLDSGCGAWQQAPLPPEPS